MGEASKRRRLSLPARVPNGVAGDLIANGYLEIHRHFEEDGEA